MSIVALNKITVCGHDSDKTAILKDLQEMGCIHLIPLTEAGEKVAQHGPSAEAREALQYLQSCPQRRRQVRDESKFDPVDVENRALDIRDRMRELEDERDFLTHRIEAIKPWGEFYFCPREQLRGYRLWFYQVPLNNMKTVEETDLIWEVVGKNNQFAWVVVISEKAPKGMPVARTRIGSKPLSELEKRLDEVELEIEDLRADRIALTKWCTLFARNLSRLEDQQAFFDAFVETYDEHPVFVLQGWAPVDQTENLRKFAKAYPVVLQIEPPGPEDEPPTLFQNDPKIQPGEDLVSFYMTPSYRLWDPSGLVLFSFAIFFAMIISDAGYSVLLALMLALGWKKLGHTASSRKTRLMFTYLIGASVVWGVLVGSYFGVSPAAGTWLAKLKILDLNDTGTMMKLSLIVGSAHIAYANLRDALRRLPRSDGWAPIGWIAMIFGGLGIYLFGDAARPVGFAAMGFGGLLVAAFTGAGEKPLKRLVSGFMGLTGISKAFGDILSYLRLFALGLASASLALAFNDLARQVADSMPGVGILLALIVLVIGHTLNLLLAIVSGFVHGLRLNLIEFFNWSITEEGRPFRAFRKHEPTG